MGGTLVCICVLTFLYQGGWVGARNAPANGNNAMDNNNAAVPPPPPAAAEVAGGHAVDGGNGDDGVDNARRGGVAQVSEEKAEPHDAEAEGTPKEEEDKDAANDIPAPAPPVSIHHLIGTIV